MVDVDVVQTPTEWRAALDALIQLRPCLMWMTSRVSCAIEGVFTRPEGSTPVGYPPRNGVISDLGRDNDGISAAS